VSRPSDYQLTVPEGWVRVDLQPGVREPALARLVDRQFRGVDNAPQLKRQARDQFLLPASLVVTLTPPPDKETLRITPDRLAQTLAGDGVQVTLTQLPAGAAVRVRHRGEATTLDGHVVVPESGSCLLLSFSTPLDTLADAMVNLFDSIASTLRWVP
jgi:hypothetical protein